MNIRINKKIRIETGNLECSQSGIFVIWFFLISYIKENVNILLYIDQPLNLCNTLISYMNRLRKKECRSSWSVVWSEWLTRFWQQKKSMSRPSKFYMAGFRWAETGEPSRENGHKRDFKADGFHELGHEGPTKRKLWAGGFSGKWTENSRSGTNILRQICIFLELCILCKLYILRMICFDLCQ